MFQIATTKHIDGILGLMREFYLAEGYPFDETVARSALEELIGNPELGEIWVATEGDEVVAYIAVTFGFSFEYGGRDAFIDELVVAPAHQGQGLGTKGLAVAEAICRTAGVRALLLEVERGKDNARRLYEKSGFVEHSRYLLMKPLA
ncbi:MAG TPA: GNAT family N-acetyltransferase [Thermoanaerobaculia bacterium]|nr:GNAT family N-acetyltransferase [Thermoanaerobaculia bacterium]